MNSPFNRIPGSILGLTLEQGRLLGAVVRPVAGAAGAFEIVRALDIPLSLDPLSHEVELVAREIRNALDAAGVREKRCVVSVPPPWILSLHGPVPDLVGEDLESILEIEAERGFPRALSELRRAHSVGRRADNQLYASQLAVPAAHLERLEAVLAKAGLRPKSIAPGLLSIPGVVPGEGRPIVTLAVSGGTVVIVVADQAGVASIRVVDGLLDDEGSERSLRSDQLVREMRVTLGQLPVSMQEEVRVIRVLGGGRLGAGLVEGLAPFAQRMGFVVEAVPKLPNQPRGQAVSEALALSPGLALAMAVLGGRNSPFEFLPPKPSAWERLNLRHNTRKLAWVGGAAAAVACLMIGAVVFRQARHGSLTKEWAAMRPKVERLEAVQQDIRKFRPWHDNGLASLHILRALSESFPEEGTVSAKSVEVMDTGEVTCAGVAKDTASLLKTMEKLASSPRVLSLKLDQSRGSSPLQFTFRFSWGEAVTQ